MSDESSVSKATLTRRQTLKFVAASSLAFGLPGRARATNQSDVIVIGAGLAGLYATWLLEQEGLKVTLLEGRDRVGGRVYTLYDIPGRPEAGGEVFGAYYARCVDMARRLDLPLRAPRPRSQAADGELMMNIRGQTILLKDWPGHALNPHPDNLRRFTPWQVFFGVLPKDNPFEGLDDWRDPRFAGYDIPFAEYLLSKGFNEESVRLQQVNTAYGNTLWDVSTLHIFHYYSWAALQASGGERTQLVDGNQRLPEGMRGVLNSQVLLNQVVRRIESDANGVAVVTAAGDRFKGKAAICTLPFSLARFVDFDPPLAGIQKQAMESLPYYKTFQIHYAFDKPFWESDGLPPSVWSDAAFGRLNLLRAVDSDEPACYLAYINGLQAARLDRMSPAAADAFVRSEIERLRPAAKGRLKALRIHSNQNDAFIGGSYAYWQPGTPLRFPEMMAQPHQRVHFAGEHTALVNRGMEGAMESAERAALEIMSALG